MYKEVPKYQEPLSNQTLTLKMKSLEKEHDHHHPNSAKNEQKNTPKTKNHNPIKLNTKNETFGKWT